MKRIIILIITLSTFSCVFLGTRAKQRVDPSADLITKATTIEYMSSADGIPVHLECNGILKGDQIKFSESDTSDINDPTIKLLKERPCPIEEKVKFTKEGIYNIFVSRTNSGTETIVFQKSAKQIVIAPISATSLSQVKATDPIEDISVPVTLEFAQLALYDGDIVIFSISADNNPSVDPKKKVDMKLANVDVSKTTHSQNVVFLTDGVYKIWIKRGGNISLQTSQTITVADNGDDDNGNMIRTSLILLIALFLF